MGGAFVCLSVSGSACVASLPSCTCAGLCRLLSVSYPAACVAERIQCRQVGIERKEDGEAGEARHRRTVS